MRAKRHVVRAKDQNLTISACRTRVSQTWYASEAREDVYSPGAEEHVSGAGADENQRKQDAFAHTAEAREEKCHQQSGGCPEKCTDTGEICLGQGVGVGHASQAAIMLLK